MPPKSKTLTMNWNQIEDVLASHLYAIRAMDPNTETIREILIKKRYGYESEMAELVIFYDRKVSE